MKKRYLPFLFVLLIFGIFSFVFLNRKDYVDMIPAESKAVVKVNCQKLSQNKDLIASLIEKIGFRPQGLDLSQPIFLYVTPNEYIGLSAAVADADELTQTFTQLSEQHRCTLPEEADGLQWTWLNDKWQVAWNNRAFLLIGPGTVQERDFLTQTLRIQFEAPKSEGLKSNPSYERLQQGNAPIRLFSQLDALPTPYNLLFRLGLPSSCSPTDIRIEADVLPEKNEWRINCVLDSEREDVKQALAERRMTKADLPNYFFSGQDAPLFFLASSTSGSELVKLLQTDATFRPLLRALNQGINANKILQSIEDNFSLHITALRKENQPLFRLEGRTQLNNLDQEMQSWIEKDGKQQGTLMKTPDGYLLENKDITLRIGKNGNRLFFETIPEGAALQPLGISSPPNKATTLRQFFILNIHQLLQQPGIASHKELLQLLFSDFNQLIYRSSNATHATLILK